MIGLVYNGQVNYITRIDDFQEFMDAAVFEAVKTALTDGVDSEGYRAKYENLQSEYENLQIEYDELEDDYDHLEDVSDELKECEETLDGLRKKFSAAMNDIQDLINDSYQGYVKPEDIVTKLEALVLEYNREE